MTEEEELKEGKLILVSKEKKRSSEGKKAQELGQTREKNDREKEGWKERKSILVSEETRQRRVRKRKGRKNNRRR